MSKLLNIKKFIPPASYFVWWTATLLIFLWFNIEWCLETSFRSFTNYSTTYIFLVAAATLFSMPAYLLPRKNGLQLAILLILGLLFEANLLYCRTYYVQIPLESYALIGNLKGFSGSVISSLKWTDILFIIVPFAAYFICRRFLQKTVRAACLTYFVVLALLSGLAYMTLAGRGGLIKRIEAMSQSVNDLQTITPIYTVFIPLLYEALTLDEPLTDEKAAEVENWLGKQQTITESYTPADSLKASKVVLILCESLESWPIGLKIDGREVTPFLNRLVSDTTVYYNPFVETQTRAGRSIDAQLLYLAGQHPLAKGVYSQKCVDYPYHTLVTALESGGAESFLFTADVPTTWNAAGIDRAFGFDNLFTGDIMGLPNPSVEKPADGELYRRVTDIMSNSDAWQPGKKAFALVVTLTGHAPFDNTPKAERYTLKGDYPSWLSDYIVTTTYADKSLEYFVSYLLAQQDADDTLIAITGDHEGLASLRNEISSDGRYSFVDQGKHTPLIMINSPYRGHDDTPIGQVDVYSALLDAAGIYNDTEWKGMGISPFASRGMNITQHADSAAYISDIMLRYSIPPVR